jgi:hypothetical protein
MMRVGTIKLIPGVLATLGLALSSSAQSEIDPDHFEMTHVEPLPQPARTVAAGRDAGGFQGSFTLRFKVECAGQTLEPGDYSVFVDWSGRGDMVTLRPKAGSGGVRAHVLSRLSGDGPNALIVQGAGGKCTLEAISLEKPKMTLYLQPEKSAKSSRNSRRIELVSVSYSSSRPAER